MSEPLHDLDDWVLDEIRAVDLGEELGGSDAHYAIRTALTQEDGSPVTVVYGVYNRETGVREIETRQLQAAYKWVEALSKMTYGTDGIADLPGLEEEEEDHFGGDDGDPPDRMH